MDIKRWIETAKENEKAEKRADPSRELLLDWYNEFQAGVFESAVQQLTLAAAHEIDWATAWLKSLERGEVHHG